MTKYWKPLLVLCGVFILLALWSPLAAQQPTGVYAQAVGTANLRSRPDVNADLIGGIQTGTWYPILGRNQFYPWLLLGDTVTFQPIGWVFQDLVTIQGNLNVVPFSEVVVGAPTPTPPPPTGTLEPSTGTPIPSPTATLQGQVIGVSKGEINIRYGPGIEYPRLGIAHAGDSFTITAYHTLFPWVQVRYANSPNGFGWVANDLLDIQGDVFSLPAVSTTQFDLPTLTPTPIVVEASALLGSTPVPISPQFQALGSQLWNMILAAGFEPDTSRVGALFLLDLQTGEAVTFGNNLAFSGMSINKIPVLTELFNVLDAPPDANLARTLGNMMICSENTATNGVLNFLGNGDEYKGAQEVTTFLEQIGIKNTFIVAPYLIPGVSTPQPVRQPTTTVDQISTSPDYSNQMTVDDMGELLGGIYQCAYDDSGALTATGHFTRQECRKMLYLMSSNRIGALIEAGVPKDTRVAHKHGWINDTHGDAGIVFTPGGNYVLVMALHNPTWLDFTESFPLIAEVSRTVYNYYNPTAPMAAIRRDPVSETCDLPSDLIDNLMSSGFDG